MSNAKIINKIESIVFTKHVNQSFIRFLQNECLESGLKGINIGGAWLSEVEQISDKVQTYINIDCPLSQNITLARLSILQSYISKFSDYIDGFNIGPVARLVDENNWDYLNKDLSAIGNLLTKSHIHGRLLINLHFMASDEQVLRLSNLALTNGFSEILIGSTSKQVDINDIIILGNLLIKDMPSKIAVFGNFIDPLHLQRASELFNSIALPGPTLFRLLESV